MRHSGGSQLVGITDASGNDATITRGNLNVLAGDQITPPIELYFIKSVDTPTTLASAATEDSYTIEVASASTLDVADYCGIFATGGTRFYFGTILDITGTTITFDTPIDFAYPSGSPVQPLTRELAVDGSGTRQIYQIGPGAQSALNIDVTRILFKIITSTVPEFGDFGDIASGITKGVVLRLNNGVMSNIFNVKLNSEFVNLMYDVSFYDARNPNQNVSGLGGRLTFAGPSKHGVALRLTPGDTLELIVQDNLSSLVSFQMIAEGHVIED
jgi:hypothetical protein